MIIYDPFSSTALVPSIFCVPIPKTELLRASEMQLAFNLLFKMHREIGK